MEVVVAPPVELVVKQALESHVTVPVYIRPPDSLPPEFVQVVRAGGKSTNPVTDEALIIVKTWGSLTVNSDLDAERLALHCRAILAASAGRTFPAGKVRYWNDSSGVAYMPDPDTGRPRYQFTGQLALRAVAI